MVLEDFTTYTEEDDGDDVAVTSTKIDVVNGVSSDIYYVRKDMGAGHFGDFEHLIKMYGTSVSDIGHLFGSWAVSTARASGLSSMAYYNEGICCYSTEASGDMTIKLRDYVTDVRDTFTGSFGVPYWLTIKRLGTTVTCKIYSDSARTDLLDTLTITADAATYQYIYGIFSRGSAVAYTATHYSENLDLQEAVEIYPVAGKGLISHTP